MEENTILSGKIQSITNILNRDVLGIILDYVPYPILLEWIDINKLQWDSLSYNPNAVHILEKKPEKINWKFLSKNPNAIHILEQNIDKIHFHYLSQNENENIWKDNQYILK